MLRQTRRRTGRGLGRESKIDSDSRPQASQLFQQRSMAARVQPWHHLCYQPNCRVLQQDCDGTSTTLPTSTHWSASECSYHRANRTFPATIQPEEGKLGAVGPTHISSMQPWRTSPPQPNATPSSWMPYEKSPERTYLVGVEWTMYQAWHPSPPNWSSGKWENIMWRARQKKSSRNLVCEWNSFCFMISVQKWFTPSIC